MHKRVSKMAQSSGVRIPELLSFRGRGEEVLSLRGDGRTQSFSLSSSALKSLASTIAGTARRAALNDLGEEEEDDEEEEDVVLVFSVELFTFLLAVRSAVFVLNIGVGLITLTALMFCIEEAEDLISFCVVGFETKGETLRGNILFVCV